MAITVRDWNSRGSQYIPEQQTILPDACIYDADEMKRVKYAYDHGHQVASHTWAHKDLTTLTWDQSTWYSQPPLIKF